MRSFRRVSDERELEMRTEEMRILS